MVSPQAKREAVTVLLTERDFGVTRACGLVGISRSLYRYRGRRPDSAALRSRIEEIAALKRRYGYRRVYLRLCREGTRRYPRSEEHTSELQSQSNLVCRLLLEQKTSHP